MQPLQVLLFTYCALAVSAVTVATETSQEQEQKTDSSSTSEQSAAPAEQSTTPPQTSAAYSPTWPYAGTVPMSSIYPSYPTLYPFSPKTSASSAANPQAEATSYFDSALAALNPFQGNLYSFAGNTPSTNTRANAANPQAQASSAGVPSLVAAAPTSYPNPYSFPASNPAALQNMFSYPSLYGAANGGFGAIGQNDAFGAYSSLLAAPTRPTPTQQMQQNKGKGVGPGPAPPPLPHFSAHVYSPALSGGLRSLSPSYAANGLFGGAALSAPLAPAAAAKPPTVLNINGVPTFSYGFPNLQGLHSLQSPQTFGHNAFGGGFLQPSGLQGGFRPLQAPGLPQPPKPAPPATTTTTPAPTTTTPKSKGKENSPSHDDSSHDDDDDDDDHSYEDDHDDEEDTAEARRTYDGTRSQGREEYGSDDDKNNRNNDDDKSSRGGKSSYYSSYAKNVPYGSKTSNGDYYKASYTRPPSNRYQGDDYHNPSSSRGRTRDYDSRGSQPTGRVRAPHGDDCGDAGQSQGHSQGQAQGFAVAPFRLPATLQADAFVDERNAAASANHRRPGPLGHGGQLALPPAQPAAGFENFRFSEAFDDFVAQPSRQRDRPRYRAEEEEDDEDERAAEEDRGRQKTLHNYNYRAPAYTPDRQQAYFPQRYQRPQQYRDTAGGASEISPIRTKVVSHNRSTKMVNYKVETREMDDDNEQDAR